MKKLYHKATVHPSPPVITDHLSFLPAFILTLAAALSPEDREVLAYLIYCSSAATPPTFSGNPRRSTAKTSVVKGGADGDHAPLFSCSCFRCYTSYWVRWNESPNRKLIDEIIDEFEDWLANKGGKKGKGRKEKRSKKGGECEKKGGGCENEKRSVEMNLSELVSSGSSESESVVGESSKNGGVGSEAVEKVVADEEKGSVRRFVSFIGEKIWGAWGQ